MERPTSPIFDEGLRPIELSEDAMRVETVATVEGSAQVVALRHAGAVAADADSALAYNDIKAGLRCSKDTPAGALREYFSDEDECEINAACDDSEGVNDAGGGNDVSASEEEEEELLSSVCRCKTTIRGVECEVLLHSSWVAHQRTHEDMRFANDRFIQYDVPGSRSLVLEQNFRLGKGGLGWDGAFILAEHLLQLPLSGASCSSPDPDIVGGCAQPGASPSAMPCKRTVVELGCGLGTAGLALVLAPVEVYGPVDVFLTDMGKITQKCRDNVELNQFLHHNHNITTNCRHFFGPADASQTEWSSASVSELSWGRENAERWATENLDQQRVDLIIAAEVVVPLFYSTQLLIETICALANERTQVVIASKHRAGEALAPAFDAFYSDLRKHFTTFEVVDPINSAIRHNTNTQNVFKIARASGFCSSSE